jgi:glycosyltransferase involved in cell wall biosynthesis
VIPNKVFQALACGAPVISADTPALRELGERGVMRVPPGDPHALAAAVRQLASDARHRNELAARGLEVYRAQASEAILGRRWRALIEALV